MGQRGPKPKPPALKLLAGNPGKRPIAGGGRKGGPKSGRPARPPELTGEAGAEWDRVVPGLDAAGWLSPIDRAALAAYCLAWAELVQATKVLDAEGRVIETPIQTARGEVVGQRKQLHPAVKLQRDAFARVKSFLVEFGLSPASRKRMGGDDEGGGEPPAGNAVLGIRDRVQERRQSGPGV